MTRTIEFQNFIVTRDKRPIIKDFTAAFMGRLIGIIGPNGAGKTTLIRGCLSLDEPMGGFYVYGTEVTRLNWVERAKLISYAQAEVHTAFSYVVKDALLLGQFPWHKGFPSRSDKMRSEEIARRLQIFDLKEKRLTDLSSGERKKVTIASALSSYSRLVILDEPMSHLDPRASFELIDVLQEIATSENRTILFSIHDLNLAFHYCDELIALKNGQLFAAGGKNHVMTAPVIKELFHMTPVFSANGLVLLP